jgi:hypothetical protein
MTRTTNNTSEAAGLSHEQILLNRGIDKILAQYWTSYAAERVDDQEADIWDMSTDEAYCAVAWTPSPHLRHVTEKLKIVQHAIGLDWSNARIEIMLASIRKDVEQLGG